MFCVEFASAALSVSQSLEAGRKRWSQNFYLALPYAHSVVDSIPHTQP
jgi:hypothetical protein